MKKRLYSTWSRFYSVAGSGATAMTKMAQSVTTGLTKAWSWLRDSFAGLPTVVLAVSYWPMLAAGIVGLPVALMPMWLDLSAWVYVFTLPLGITAGMIAFLGAYMMLDD